MPSPRQRGGAAIAVAGAAVERYNIATDVTDTDADLDADYEYMAEADDPDQPGSPKTPTKKAGSAGKG